MSASKENSFCFTESFIFRDEVKKLLSITPAKTLVAAAFPVPYCVVSFSSLLDTVYSFRKLQKLSFQTIGSILSIYEYVAGRTEQQFSAYKLCFLFVDTPRTLIAAKLSIRVSRDLHQC